MTCNNNICSRFLNFHSNFAGNLFSRFGGLTELRSIFYFLHPLPPLMDNILKKLGQSFDNLSYSGIARVFICHVF